MNITLGFPIRVTAWIVAAALLSGCGGGGGAPSSALPGTTTTNGSSATTVATGKSVKVRFHVAHLSAAAAKQAQSSKRNAAASQRRGTQSARMTAGTRSPKYVSPSTAGVAIFATDATTSKTLAPTYADISLYSPANGNGLSPLCAYTDGTDDASGYDCQIQGPAVPGDTITFTAVTVDRTPDNECTTAGPTCQLAYGTGFSSGGELSIGKSVATYISTSGSTTISLTLDPMIAYFCFDGLANYGTVVVPADGSPHAITAQAQPEDYDSNVVAMQVSGELFVDPAGTPTALSATSQSPSLVYSGSSGQARVSIPLPAASPGTVSATFTYSGAPNGTGDYGADPVSIVFDNNLNSTTGVPLVGSCSPFDTNYNNSCSYGGASNGQGYYESNYDCEGPCSYVLVAPFTVTANTTSLGPSLTSIPVTVALYGASSGFNTTIGGTSNCNTGSNAYITVTPQGSVNYVYNYTYGYIYYQAYTISYSSGSAGASCSFNFTSVDYPSALSGLITVTYNAAGSGFSIHVPGTQGG